MMTSIKEWIGKLAFNVAYKLGGVDAIIAWLCKKVTDLLAKIKDKDEFAAYAEDVNQLGAFLQACFDRHQKWMSEAKRSAAKETVESIRVLADALKDCEITKEEVDKLIDAVIKAIEAWKVADAKPAQIVNITTPVLLAAVIGGASLLSGCRAFYENAGSHTVVGSLTAPVEVSEPTSSCNIRALYSMDGADVYTAKDSLVKIKYANQYTNDYFYIVKTQGKQDLEVEIEPLDTSSPTNAPVSNL